jgi:hypothetical protein
LLGSRRANHASSRRPGLGRALLGELTTDIPTIPQVLAAILPDLPANRVLVAEEQQQLSPARWREHQEGPLPVEAVSHLECKHLARYATGCIRTGARSLTRTSSWSAAKRPCEVTAQSLHALAGGVRSAGARGVAGLSSMRIHA